MVVYASDRITNCILMHEHRIESFIACVGVVFSNTVETAHMLHDLENLLRLCIFVIREYSCSKLIKLKLTCIRKVFEYSVQLYSNTMHTDDASL